jgi:hypothetical protein
MSSRSRLYRDVYQLIEQGLCSQGMQKYEQGIYGRQLTTEARGMVGLNVATRYGFRINPIIGVQYLPLEHLLADLKEWPFHPTKCGDSIASPIGYLGPAKMFWTWKFEEGKDNAATVAEMVDEITTIGFRYMEQNCTLEKVCERLAVDRHFIMGNDVYQLPVGYMMLGRFDEAESLVRNELARIAAYKAPTIEEREAALGEKLDARTLEQLEKLEDEPIPAHEAYRRFAERFFHRLEEERKRASAE